MKTSPPDKIPPKDIYKDLSRTKEHLITAENEKDYIPEYMNKSFSYYPVTVLFANEMNMNWHLDKLMQYDFYFHMIPAKNRSFSAWGKRHITTPEEEAVSLYFGYGLDRVKEVIHLLTPEQMEIIMKYAENLKEINTS